MIFHYTFTAESEGERILKIGQHLPKLWAIKYRVVLFMKHGVLWVTEYLIAWPLPQRNRPAPPPQCLGILYTFTSSNQILHGDIITRMHGVCTVMHYAQGSICRRGHRGLTPAGKSATPAEKILKRFKTVAILPLTGLQESSPERLPWKLHKLFSDSQK